MSMSFQSFEKNTLRLWKIVRKYNANIFAVIGTTFCCALQRCTPDALVTAISSKG